MHATAYIKQYAWKIMNTTIKHVSHKVTLNHLDVRDWWEFAFSPCIDIKISKAGCGPLGAAIEYVYDAGSTTCPSAMFYRLSMGCHTVSPAPVWVRIPGP